MLRVGNQALIIDPASQFLLGKWSSAGFAYELGQPRRFCHYRAGSAYPGQQTKCNIVQSNTKDQERKFIQIELELPD